MDLYRAQSRLLRIVNTLYCLEGVSCSEDRLVLRCDATHQTTIRSEQPNLGIPTAKQQASSRASLAGRKDRAPAAARDGGHAITRHDQLPHDMPTHVHVPLHHLPSRPYLDLIFFRFWYCNTFVFIWQILSNHRVIRFKRFVSWFINKLYN